MIPVGSNKPRDATPAEREKAWAILRMIVAGVAMSLIGVVIFMDLQ